WLNQQPEVQKLITEQFGGHAIRAQNISQWRAGGYVDWRRHQLLREQTRWTAEQSADLGLDTSGRSISIAEDIANIISAELALHVHALGAMKNPKQRFRQFRHLSHELSRLRRDDQRALRIQLRHPGSRLHLDPQHRQSTPEPVEPPSAGGASVPASRAQPATGAEETTELAAAAGAPAERASLPDCGSPLPLCETRPTPPAPVPNSSTPKPLNSKTPTEERQGAGALQDAPRNSSASATRASTPDCGGPLPLSETVENPKASPTPEQPPYNPPLPPPSTLNPQPPGAPKPGEGGSTPPPHIPIPTKTHYKISGTPIRARHCRWIEG